MICAIHQPQYLPWLGYFDKMDRADVFVFLDDTQFKKNEWQNRNRIKTAQGWQWITVPVMHHFGQNIRDVKINNDLRWPHKHTQALRQNYGKAGYFERYWPFFEEMFAREWAGLGELNMHVVTGIARELGIDTTLLVSSEVGKEGEASEALISICKRVGADAYLSGEGGRGYVEEERFEEAGIALEYQQYQHPEYPQRFGEFVSHLSVVDLLFNVGPDSLDVIRQGRQT